jgi:hypothetical protein
MTNALDSQRAYSTVGPIQSPNDDLEYNNVSSRIVVMPEDGPMAEDGPKPEDGPMLEDGPKPRLDAAVS